MGNKYQDAVHMEVREGYDIVVEYDVGTESPADWGDEIQILIETRKYKSPATFYDSIPDSSCKYGTRVVSTVYKTIAEVDEAVEAGDLFAKTLYGYEHSGFTISDTPFGCRWDSGIAGRIVARTAEELANEKHVESVISTWRTYLGGEVYTISVRNPETGEVVASVCGWYGDYEEGINEIVDEALAEHGPFVSTKRKLLNVASRLREAATKASFDDTPNEALWEEVNACTAAIEALADAAS